MISVLAPPLILIDLLLTSDRTVMGNAVNSRTVGFLGWLTFAVMVVSALGLFFARLSDRQPVHNSMHAFRALRDVFRLRAAGPPLDGLNMDDPGMSRCAIGYTTPGVHLRTHRKGRCYARE